MLKPMFGHRPKHKKFKYKFRYYDPKEDERKKRRIKIDRPNSKRRGKQTRSVLMLAAGLALVIWIISIL